MKRYIILFLLLSQASNAQKKTKLIDSLFEINSPIHLGKNIDSINYIKIVESTKFDVRDAFSPVIINYFVKDYQISTKELSVDSVFVNADSLKQISAIIFRSKNIVDFETALISNYGRYTSQLYFNSGVGNIYTRGWTTDKYCIIIQSTSTGMSTFILYNCLKSNILNTSNVWF